MENRAPLLFALLLLLFFVSTSAGLADISAIQDQLRSAQLKLIGEKLKLLQEGVLGLRTAPAPPPAVASPATPEPTREELSRILEDQIKILQDVVASLRPKAIDEEASRIEQELTRIIGELKTASGDQLVVLRNQLDQLVAAHDTLTEQVRQSLEDSLKYKQALIISEQIRILQEKISTLPRPSTAPNPLVQEQNTTLMNIQDAIQKLQLKILQAQIKVIQEKVHQVAQ